MMVQQSLISRTTAHRVRSDGSDVHLFPLCRERVSLLNVTLTGVTRPSVRSLDPVSSDCIFPSIGCLVIHFFYLLLMKKNAFI